MTACAVGPDESDRNWLTHTYTGYTIAKLLCSGHVSDPALLLPSQPIHNLGSFRIMSLRYPVLISRRCAAPVMIDDHVAQSLGGNALAPVSSLRVALRDGITRRRNQGQTKPCT